MKPMMQFGSALLLATSVVSLALPVLANGNLRNVRLSGIDADQRVAYCANYINLSKDKIQAKPADTHVYCQARISARASTRSQATAQAQAQARRSGLSGNVNVRADGRQSWVATFTSFQNSYHLSKWCQMKHAPNLYLFNPFTGEGRIFVAEGGNACHKTEKR
jgi:acylphosphatase